MSALNYAACAVVALALTGTGAMAQEAPRQVAVKGIKHPQMHSYRSVWAGLDAFDKHRALAPQAAALRFRIAPHANNPAAAIDGVTLHIVGQGDAIAVPIANGQFAIERNQAAYDDRADLMFNHKRHLCTTFAEVRTPGLPSNARRLGDLRLECQVNLAIIKKEAPFHIVAAVNTLLVSIDWCNKVGIYLSVPTERLHKATLVHGARTKNVAVEELPMHTTTDRPWPDDTRLVLEYGVGVETVAGDR